MRAAVGKHWECEVPNLLSGSAVAVQGKFGVDARPWKSCPSHARTCGRVREGKLRPHGHPEGSRLPQGRKGTGLPRSWEAAAQGAQQRPAAIWEGATRWKIGAVPGGWVRSARRGWEEKRRSRERSSPRRPALATPGATAGGQPAGGRRSWTAFPILPECPNVCSAQPGSVCVRVYVCVCVCARVCVRVCVRREPLGEWRLIH